MKQALVITFCFMLIGCKRDDGSMYRCNGIPDENQAFSHMSFIDKERGYLFGTFTRLEDMTEEDLSDRAFTPKYTEEATIYKTEDGGYNWEKIDSVVNKGYADISMSEENSVYAVLKDSQENFKNTIVRIALPSIEKIESGNIKTISAIWKDSSAVNFSNNRGDIFWYKLNDNLSLKDSVLIKKYVLKGISYRDRLYGLFVDKESTFFASIDARGQYQEIDIPVIPKDFVVLDDTKLLLIGNSKDADEIRLMTFDTETGSAEHFTEFKEYSIAQGLQVNDKVIVGFLGNRSDAFNRYDLMFSLDKGKTWHIQNLEEPSYIRPSCLVDDILYIYSGGARMQKVSFSRLP